MKTKYIAVIVLVLLAATVVALYYANMSAWDLGPTAVHHKTNQQSQPTATTTLPADIIDWKTYTDSKFGYEISYDPQYIFYEDSNNNQISISQKSPSYEFPAPPLLGLTVHIASGTNINLQDWWLNKEKSTLDSLNNLGLKDNYTVHAATIDGMEAMEFHLTSDSSDEIIAQKDRKIYDFYLGSEIGKQILTTFKFIKQN